MPAAPADNAKDGHGYDNDCHQAIENLPATPGDPLGEPIGQ